MKKKTLGTLLQYVIFLGLGILLIWWQSNHLTPKDREEIFASLSKVRERLWLIFPVITIGFLSHLFRALRWKLLLETINLRPTTVNITCAVMVGYIVNLLLPRMGEIARCTVLAKYEKEPADKIVGTIVAERSFDIVCLLLVVLLTFLLQINLIGDYAMDLFQKLASRSGTIIIALIVLVAIILVAVFYYRKHRATKVGHVIAGVGAGVKSILKMKKRGLFLVYTALIWICYLGLVVVGFYSIAETEHLGLLPALSVLVFGSIGMIITPGGLGAYPIAVQQILMEYGIGGSYALAFGWISWLAQTLVILIFGLISLLILPIYNVKPHGENTVDPK